MQSRAAAVAMPPSTAGLSSRRVKNVQERWLFQRYASGDPQARAELVTRFIPLARRVARGYVRTGEDFDDLLQVASFGLLKAIDRFDPAIGTAFSSFAVPTIDGELKRHLRNTRWAAHVPRGVQERSLKVSRTTDELSAELGRSPTVVEVAERTRLASEEVIEAQEAALAIDVVPIEPLDADGDAGGGVDSLPCEEDGYERVEWAVSAAPPFHELPPREQEILYLRFGKDLTQSQIAAGMGLSQMHVSRLIRKSLAAIHSATSSG